MNRQPLYSLISLPCKARRHKPYYRPGIEILEQRLAPSTLLPGFTETTVASGLIDNTAMEFSPDGRLWVLDEEGDVSLVHADGSKFTALQLNVDSSGGRGLLGIAFDPNFTSNHFVYLHYTNPNSGTAPWAAGAHDQISRFTVNDANPLQPILGNEAPILDLNSLTGPDDHLGGAIHFGADGMLYVPTGDDGQTFTGPDSNTYRVSQTLANMLGKLLRVDVAKFNSGAATRDDTAVGHLIPAANPFVGQAQGINQLIYALGLRNPFTFAVQPGTGRTLINDVGEDTWEEIDDASAGANYGWSGGNTDGYGNPPPAFAPGTYHDPLLAYTHSGSASLATGYAIVGGDFYNPATVQFPASYVGKYFYQDLVTGWIRYFDPNQPNVAGTPDGNSVAFATSKGDLRDLKVGADGNLYFLCDADGAIHKISYDAQETTGMIVANGQPGYSETGNWFTEAVGTDYGGTDRYAAASGNGNNTATWQVTGLSSGAYKVQATWPRFSNQASNAPYSIYDGSTLVTTVLVDQTQAPSGFIYGDATFQLLSTVNITSGTLKVVLSNTGTNNTWIIANAVRIAAVATTSPVIIANGQPGYSETGNWFTETVGTDYGGTDRYASASGNGNNTATWQAGGLVTGDYTVEVTWPPFSNQPTNAPFAVYDGATLLTTVLVDETAAPMGAVYGGATFKLLGTVHITSGTLKVVLSNTGTNHTWIIANAVRIAPAPSSNTDLNWAASGDGISGPPSTTTQSTFTISRSYTVSGAAAPQSFKINYYASTNPSTGQDFSQAILLGAETISAASDLALGNHAGISPAFQINANGSFYLFAKLNANSDFLETNAANNLAVTAATTTVSGAVTSNPVIITNGQSGYSETGNWFTESVGTDYGGTDRYASASGNGNNTATWQAGGLVTGDYTVEVTWPPFSNQPTNAPFAIYDGSTLLTTDLVDETAAPTGAVYGGATFKLLGTVHISSGTLKVVLSNTGTNHTWIIANAVRIAPAPSSNTDLNWAASGDGISGPASTTTQSTFTISRTYTISGAAAPQSFKINYYASTNPSTSQDFGQAILLGSETISAASDLDLGNHAGVSPDFQINANGNFYLFAKLNANTDFVESDATNNLAVTAGTTAVTGPVTSNPVIIANGQSGYSETGLWSTETVASDYGGTDRYASASGNGNNTATWQAGGLVTGDYTVEVTWPPFSNQPTNAPFAVYDGSTLLQTFLVDQTQSPSGSVYGGTTFKLLGTVHITSGTLKVVLSNTGTNHTWIIANAVRIAPATSSNTDLNWAASGDGISGPPSTTTQSTFTISRTYTVSGAAAPQSFKINYYASTNPSTGQDFSQAILLGAETINAPADLALGNHVGTSPAFQINANGNFYLFAKLNANTDFVETNANNNLAVTTTTTAVTGPVTSNPVIIANGQPGYSETGSWFTESVGTDYGGTDRYASASGNGNNTATWQTTGLAPGNYTVEVTWPPFSNQATNAPFAIYDGATLLTTVLVDETAAPTGAVYGGATFKLLGTVHITSGTLKVVLSNTGTNHTWIIANAVRLAPA